MKQDKTLFSAAGLDLAAGPDWASEARLMAEVVGPVCGVDEVGRGPLAGPVVAAAVILHPDRVPVGLNDSKKLTEKKREHLFDLIHEQALAVCIAEASVAEIDEINILEAAMLAMRRAVEGLETCPSGALVDGNRDPGLGLPTRTLVKGDARSLSIAAASIVAKVFRDRLMKNLALQHPDYGWEQNAGYGVPRHMAALRLVGVSPHHRKSFAPIRQILSEE
ncbi:MAG: ribonuclease HII [Alphaproteobacteria bacterium]|nr:MAG: ribonuclease HII [Alphaproteobacteria bacterium]